MKQRYVWVLWAYSLKSAKLSSVLVGLKLIGYMDYPLDNLSCPVENVGMGSYFASQVIPSTASYLGMSMTMNRVLNGMCCRYMVVLRYWVEVTVSPFATVILWGVILRRCGVRLCL